MKLRTKDHLLQDVWAWISLVINIILSWISIAISYPDKSFLWVAILSVVFFAFIGAMKVDRDLTINDLSTTSIVLTYMAQLLLSGVFAYCSCIVTSSWLGVILIIIAIFFEAIIGVIIGYRYRIKNKLVTFFKKRKKKKAIPTKKS